MSARAPSRAAVARAFPQLDPASPEAAIIERLRAGSLVVGRCWLWQGYTRNGYPTLSMRNHPVYGHRLACQLAHGIPPGMETCHRCDVRRCWNPACLFPGTRRDNIMDARAKGRMPDPPRVTGPVHHKAPLSSAQVAAIRAAAGSSQRELAVVYGCSQSTIGRIRQGKVRLWG